MQNALVVGHATSTVKHASMQGWKLLIVQPLQVDGETPDGEPLLAIDSLGAGMGMEVMITSDGKSTRELVKCNNTPIRWSVLGIVDETKRT
jgi:ethanolamine utilization protein EutN